MYDRDLEPILAVHSHPIDTIGPEHGPPGLRGHAFTEMLTDAGTWYLGWQENGQSFLAVFSNRLPKEQIIEWLGTWRLLQ